MTQPHDVQDVLNVIRELDGTSVEGIGDGISVEVETKDGTGYLTLVDVESGVQTVWVIEPRLFQVYVS